MEILLIVRLEIILIRKPWNRLETVAKLLLVGLSLSEGIERLMKASLRSAAPSRSRLDAIFSDTSLDGLSSDKSSRVDLHLLCRKFLGDAMQLLSDLS